MLKQNGIKHGSTLLRDHWKMLNVDYTVLLQTKLLSLGNILTIGGCFNCVTSHACYSARLAEERKKKKKEDEQF